MKLSIFLPSLRGGGAERAMLRLANGFAQSGHNVDLVLAQAEGPYLNDVCADVRVVGLDVPRVLRAMPKLVRYLRRERPDAMLTALPEAGVVAMWASKIARWTGPAIVSVQNRMSEPAQSRGSVVRVRLMPLWAGLFYRWAHAISAVSAGVADDLFRCAKLPRDRVHVIYNPVLVPELYDQAARDPEDEWFAHGEPPVILGIGRLVPAKDFATLLRAFELVRSRRSARLMILGEGPERPYLESLAQSLGIAESVRLPGFIPNPYSLLSRAGVFVLSSLWEGMPTVLVESLALGTPVVATDCPSGPRELLGDSEVLVAPGDVEGLAGAIDTVLSGQCVTPDVDLERFTLDAAVTAYTELLNLPTKK